MDYTTRDIKEYLGEKKGHTHINKLIREKLGYSKMETIYKKARNTKGETRTLVALKYFNPDKVIEHFQKKKDDVMTGKTKHKRPQYIESWDDAISVAEHFKEIN